MGISEASIGSLFELCNEYCWLVQWNIEVYVYVSQYNGIIAVVNSLDDLSIVVSHEIIKPLLQNVKLRSDFGIQ